MAGDSEDIGGISVSIGASHARLSGDLKAADAVLETWLKDRVVNIRANVTMPAGTPAQRQVPVQAPARPVRPGASDFGGGLAVQSRGQAAQQKAATRRNSILDDPFYARQITTALAQTGEQLDKNNEIVAAGTKATRGHRAAIMEVQQAASQPIALAVSASASEADLRAVLALLTEIAAVASRPVEVSAAAATPPTVPPPDISSATEALDRLAATVAEVQAAIVRPTSLNVVTAEAQDQLAAVLASAQALRTEISQPVQFAVRPAESQLTDQKEAIAEVQDQAALPVALNVDATKARAGVRSVQGDLDDVAAAVQEPVTPVIEVAKVAPPDTSAVLAAIDRLDAAVASFRTALAEPVKLVLVAVEAQDQIATTLAAVRELRAEVSRPMPLVVQGRVAGIADEKAAVAGLQAQAAKPVTLNIVASEGVEAQGEAVAKVKETAATPTTVAMDFSAAQTAAEGLLTTMQAVLVTAKEVAATPARRGGGGGKRPKVATSADDDFPPMEEPRGATRESSTFAPPMTQARRAEIEREQAAAAARRAAAPPVAPPPPRTGPSSDLGAIRARAREERTVRQAIRADQARDEEVFAQAAPDKAIQREREIEERIARARSGTTASARTGRTASSGLGALGLGTQGKLIEANARLTASDKALAEAEKGALPFRRRIAEYDEDIATSSTKVAAARTIVRNAFASDPKTVAALEKERQAILGQQAALEGVRKLQSGTSILRNLSAITLGGAAFGFGLQAVGVAFDLIGKAATPAIDRMTGFATVAGRVTDALSDQTKQANGNVQAIVAMATAQAALSAAAAKTVSPIIAQQVSIEAGNKNLADAVGLFQTYSKFQQQGVSGVTSNTGGPLGNGFLGTPSALQSVGTLLQGLPSQKERSGTDTQYNLQAGFFGFNPFGLLGSTTTEVPNANQGANQKLFGEGLGFINEQAERGGEKRLRLVESAGDQGAVDRSIQAAQTARAPDDFINALRDGKIAIQGLSDNAGEAAAQILQLGTAVNLGTQRPDPSSLRQIAISNEEQRQRESAAAVDAIRSQQQFAMPSIIGLAQRQTQYATQVQQPTQFALSALANPDLAVGTGIAKGDQAKVAGTLKEANDLQDQLNTKYAQGEQIIKDTYRRSIVTNFGAAAATAFDSALNAVRTTGAEIAKVQAGISNEQAAYQVAQYNFQLQIAKRSLSDIGGLTGQNFGAGQSYLGVLERQNLELSRQGQQLQFNMSQRQINFQTALAGFQAPGVTPEERQARVKEAEIEASFAQKQLNIQRQMFGNQVKIVDIGNLRQGRDLVRQIGLLQQGRQVTIDTAAAEQKLIRLNKLQSRNVAEVSTYLSAVDSLAATAMGQIQQLEAAAGQAMAGVATSILGQFGIFFAGLNQVMGGGGGRGGNPTTPGSSAGSGPGGRPPDNYEDRGTSFAYGQVVPRNGEAHKLTAGEADWELSHGTDLNGNGRLGYASGGAWNLGRPTRIGANGMAGEAGDETLLILSHPRSAASGSSGSGAVVIQFNGDIHVRSENDLEQIARKVEQSLGRTLSLKGFRSG